MKILWFSFLAILWLPSLYYFFPISQFRPLRGSFSKVLDTSFTPQRWFSENFQHHKEKYLAQNVGFSAPLIRFNNEWKFRLFNKIYAQKVVNGKDNFLFEEPYILCRTKPDSIDLQFIDTHAQRMVEIRDTLLKLNIPFLVVIAPNKAYYYEEKIPESYGKPVQENFYTHFLKFLKEKQIPHIDFNSWFRSKRFTSVFPLFPQTGIHWSCYGSFLALDSVQNWIEEVKGIKMPRIYWNEVLWYPDTLHFIDDDIEGSMNLLFEIPKIPVAFPKVKIDNPNGVKPKILIVGDSFYNNWADTGVMSQICEPEFWYYNENPINKNPEVFKNHIRTKDLVILLATEPNLQGIGWGFLEQLHFMYFKKVEMAGNYAKQRIAEIEKSILNDPNWFEAVAKKAKQRGISIEEMVRLDAIYVFEQEN